MSTAQRVFTSAAISLILVSNLSLSNGQSLFSGPKPDEIPFQTLSSEFHRIYEDEYGVQELRGTFYYLGPGRMFVDVIEPLKQIVDIRTKTSTIYYPDHERAFYFEGKAPEILPMIPGIIGATLSDYGLSGLGFSIYDQEMSGDTLVTFWHHPATEGELGRFRLGSLESTLVFAILELPGEKGEIRTRFTSHQTIDGLTLPVGIRTENETSRGELVLTNTEVNPPIPEEVSTFKVPEGIPVEKRVW